MSLKEAFTPEEWARVVGAPMLASIAVTAADPGGLWGAVKESVAVAGAIGKAAGGGSGGRGTATRPRSRPPASSSGEPSGWSERTRSSR